MIFMMKAPKWELVLFFVTLITLLTGACGNMYPVISPVATQPISLNVTAVPTNSFHKLDGLIYRIDNEIWMFDKDERPSRLMVLPEQSYQPAIQYSSEYFRIVYIHLDDVWVADLQDQTTKNITNTHERVERFPQFLNSKQNIIVFNSFPVSDYSYIGVPTVAKIDGSDYQVLDENGFGNVIISPEDSKIAYHNSHSTLAIYDFVTNETEIVDFTTHRLPLGELGGISIQALSPDGKHLAGWMKGQITDTEKWQIGIGVINLQNKTIHTFHIFSPISGSETTPSLSWHSNGQWLVYATKADPGYAGEFLSLWVSRTDGSNEIHIDVGDNPVWHPSENRLAYDRKVKAVIDGIWIYDLDTASKNKVPIPNEAILIDWISIIP